MSMITDDTIDYSPPPCDSYYRITLSEFENEYCSKDNKLGTIFKNLCFYFCNRYLNASKDIIKLFKWPFYNEVFYSIKIDYNYIINIYYNTSKCSISAALEYYRVNKIDTSQEKFMGIERYNDVDKNIEEFKNNIQNFMYENPRYYS